MTRSIVIAVLLAVLVFSGASAREWVPIREEQTAEVVTSITSSDISTTVIEVEIPGMLVEPAFRGTPGELNLAIPGARSLSSPGMPDLPVLSYLLAVPDYGEIELEIVAIEERVLEGYDVAAAAPFAIEGREAEDAVRSEAVYAADAFYPAEVASVGEPGVLRDLRLASVRVNPVRYNPVTRQLSVVERLKVAVTTTGGQGVNPKRIDRDFRSAAFEPIYAAVVDNYDQLPRAEVRRGSYLVITVDEYVAALTDFVEWKQQRGVETELVPLSAIGMSPTNADIKAYIQNAYDTWPNPPDYVLLVGDSTTSGIYGTMPCWYLPAIPFNHVIDHPYAELDGGDYFPDVILGRMSVDSPTEALVACMKVLSYERDCDGPNNTWYKNAVMVAGNFGATPPPTSPRQTVLRVREMLYDCDYAQVDTIFYPPYITPNPIGATIDAGVGIVNYRGWGNDAGWHYPEYYTDDIQSLSNGNALPIMTSCVCGSNAWESWGYDPCFGEAWIRAGSPGDLKGGPAMLGPSDRNTHTRWNNAMGSGIYQGMLYEGLEHFGQILVRGKLEVWKWFIDERDPGDWVDYYHNIYSVMGDPELWLRTDTPGSFVVECDTTIPAGQNYVTLDVSDASRGGVVSGFEVAVRT
ncbi:MAG TPA: C25 family cysteine peptidase, partial [bacterium]|nr:C25 family cysteine peptidase [bacterium]